MAAVGAAAAGGGCFNLLRFNSFSGWGVSCARSQCFNGVKTRVKALWGSFMCFISEPHLTAVPHDVNIYIYIYIYILYL